MRIYRLIFNKKDLSNTIPLDISKTFVADKYTLTKLSEIKQDCNLDIETMHYDIKIQSIMNLYLYTKSYIFI